MPSYYYTSKIYFLQKLENVKLSNDWLSIIVTTYYVTTSLKEMDISRVLIIHVIGGNFFIVPTRDFFLQCMRSLFHLSERTHDWYRLKFTWRKFQSCDNSIIMQLRNSGGAHGTADHECRTQHIRKIVSSYCVMQDRVILYVGLRLLSIYTFSCFRARLFLFRVHVTYTQIADAH